MRRRRMMGDNNTLKIYTQFIHPYIKAIQSQSEREGNYKMIVLFIAE